MSAEIIALPTRRNRNPHIKAPEVVAFRRDVQADALREARINESVRLASEAGRRVNAHRGPMLPMQPGLNKMDRLAAIRCLQAWAAELGLAITVHPAGGVA